MKKILFIIFVSILLSANIVRAQDYKLLEPLPCVDITTGCSAGSTQPTININNYIQYVYKFSIALAVFLAIVVLIYGGFEYMLSAGSITKKSSAQARMKNAVLGLLAALTSYLILLTIDPRLVQINTTIPQLKITIDQSTLDFSSQIQKDISDLNATDKAKVLGLQNQNEESQKAVDFLENKKKQPGGLTPEEEVNLQSSKLDIKRNQADIIKTETSFRFSHAFSEDFAILHSSASYAKPFSETIGPTIFFRPGELSSDAALQQERFLYQLDSATDYANTLEKIGYPEDAVKVKATAQFYRDQMNEEEQLMKNIMAYNFHVKYLDKAEIIDFKSKLKSALQTYTDATPPGKYDPVLLKEYETLKTQRVTLIKQTLRI